MRHAPFATADAFPASGEIGLRGPVAYGGSPGAGGDDIRVCRMEIVPR